MLIIAMAAALAAPTSGKAKIPVPTAFEKAAIRRYLDAAMYDGPSARLKWPAGARPFYCGWINAKNRVGAYTGWRAYLVHFDENGAVADLIMPEHADLATAIMIRESCKNQGTDVDLPPR